MLTCLMHHQLKYSLTIVVLLPKAALPIRQCKVLPQQDAVLAAYRVYIGTART